LVFCTPRVAGCFLNVYIPVIQKRALVITRLFLSYK
jgi:hypothetical protein